MKVFIQLTKEEEAKALPILLRHSPGTILPNRTYSVSQDAASELRQSGVRFAVLSRESIAPNHEEAGTGERI